ncbi:MAG: iron(III) transport system substrate-binding protein, partial [Gammaproteobacteria bacterium]
MEIASHNLFFNRISERFQMYKIKHPLIACLLAILVSTNALSAEVNIYSARKEALIKPLLDKFSAETGIKTNLITANA